MVHLCGVTLLRRPPGPVVFVTAAHCTLLCKSGENIVPNCCCENVSQRICSANEHKCGKNPVIVNLTGKFMNDHIATSYSFNKQH